MKAYYGAVWDQKATIEQLESVLSSDFYIQKNTVTQAVDQFQARLIVDLLRGSPIPSPDHAKMLTSLIHNFFESEDSQAEQLPKLLKLAITNATTLIKDDEDRTAITKTLHAQVENALEEQWSKIATNSPTLGPETPQWGAVCKRAWSGWLPDADKVGKVVLENDGKRWQIKVLKDQDTPVLYLTTDAANKSETMLHTRHATRTSSQVIEK
jgi:hypothetical protein